ncbi:MAG: class I SAM-dependent methyltransferase [Altibacter sp.]|uniref:class I SAM-dependent methyltransferase n=1 Tax=Altibacter sp. TaxID=2024823 RepID=UPI001DB4E020|nr:class I SAM-dependent methyltransferase [Altibacter sp.]MBZ0326116.1 class I SAM-dependent methyltransferase [Altibacter sp.]
MKIKDTIANEFNEFSNNYTHDMIACVPHYLVLLSSMTQGLSPNFNPKTILDLGCGNGNVTSLLTETFPDSKYTLLDASPEMIALCKQRFKEYQMVYATAYFNDFQFSVETYDLITAGFSLHHCDLAEKKQLFKKIYTALKPGGVFAYTDLMIDKNTAEHSAFLKRWEAFVLTNFPDGEKWEWLVEHYTEFDKPDDLKKQLQWLRDVGFENIIPTVKDDYWVHIRAIKT